MSTRAADIMRKPAGAVFAMYAAPLTYERAAQSFPNLLAAVRDLKELDLFGSAAVGDRLVVVRAADFDALGIGRPARYDRAVMNDGVFVVMDWRAAPPLGEAVFYRLAARGGTK